MDLPEIGQTRASVEGDTITFLTIEHDEVAENPADMSDVRVYSYNRRHVNFDKDGEGIRMLEEHPDRAFVLSYYEHGGSLWYLSDDARTRAHTMDPGGWDTVRVGGIILVPDDATNPRKYAKAFLSEYNDWCNGNVYVVFVQRYTVRRTDNGIVYNERSDYRFDAPLFHESYGGVYGLDGIKAAAAEMLEESAS